jgi:hypothetical protein
VQVGYGAFDCSARDIYREFGEEPSCYNFGSFSSFEKDTLTSQDRSSLPVDINNLIEAGYCAPEIRATVDASGVSASSSGSFSCFGTCNGQGDCGYQDTNACACSANFGADSVCSGISATTFFAGGGSDVFYCADNGNAACLNTCQAETNEDISIEACHCQRRSGNGVTRLPSDTSFFFEGNYDSTLGSSCCSGNNDIYYDGGLRGASVCIQGDLKKTNTVFSIEETKDAISCDGEVYICAPSDICTIVPTDSFDPVNDCLYVEAGTCSYRDKNSINNDCAQTPAPDLQALGNLPYVAKISMDGEIISCNYRCNDGQWELNTD